MNTSTFFRYKGLGRAIWTVSDAVALIVIIRNPVRTTSEESPRHHPFRRRVAQVWFSICPTLSPFPYGQRSSQPSTLKLLHSSGSMCYDWDHSIVMTCSEYYTFVVPILNKGLMRLMPPTAQASP